MQLKTITEENPQCRRCGSTDVDVSGRPQLSAPKKAMVQQYTCRKCRSKFFAGTYLRHHFPKETIDWAVAQVKRGYLLRDVAKAVSEKAGYPVCSTTVLKWIRDFAPEFKMPPHGWMRSGRKLALTIRRLVSLKTLAAELECPEEAVDAFLTELAQKDMAAHLNKIGGPWPPKKKPDKLRNRTQGKERP